MFGFAYVAVILLWRFIPARIRITSIAVFILWSAGMSVVGVLREVRIFSELSALVLLMVGAGVHRLLQESRNSQAVSAAQEITTSASSNAIA